MQITSQALLKTIFRMKGNFAAGPLPEVRQADGLQVLPFRNGASAAACFSADFELNWAWREWDSRTRDGRGRSGRSNFPLIVQILEDFRVPVTWATVGHLFLHGCRRDCNGQAHSDLPRPPRNDRWRGDWYRHDPCTDLKRDPLWYAPDLIEKLIESRVGHEIGSHSFSHIEFAPHTSNAHLVRREIEECTAAMQPFGLYPRSLVYPFNVMGHQYLDLLSDLGILAVRHQDEKVKLGYPERSSSGVYRLYETLQVRTTERYRYMDRVRLLLQEAIKCFAVLHFWFHPSDPRSVFEGEFRQLVAYLSEQRDKGVLWVATMKELASYCEARRNIQWKVKRQPAEMLVEFKGAIEAKYGHPDLTLKISVPGRPRRVILEDAQGSRKTPQTSTCCEQAQEIQVNVPFGSRSLRLVF